jgi:hypothetical protein
VSECVTPSSAESDWSQRCQPRNHGVSHSANPRPDRSKPRVSKEKTRLLRSSLRVSPRETIKVAGGHNHNQREAIKLRTDFERTATPSRALISPPRYSENSDRVNCGISLSKSRQRSSDRSSLWRPYPYCSTSRCHLDAAVLWLCKKGEAARNSPAVS